MMKRFVLYTSALSAHQIPMAREIVKRIGPGHFKYIYTSRDGQKLQECNAHDKWIDYAPDGVNEGCIENADIVLSGLRNISLFEHRSKKGLKTFYMSERWFKPPIGMFRILVPSYRRMAERFVRLLDVGGLIYLPIGIHAARDMARLYGLIHGDWRCLFKAPELEFERKPGGRIWLKNSHVEHVAHVEKKYCLDKMRMWGYYVSPSSFDALPVQEASNRSEVRVLWVGRLLNLKRVDTIVRAVGEHANLKRVDNSLPKITLDIYGTGSMEARLKKMAARYGDVIKFHPPVPIDDVRKLMRSHDVYVLASNAYEGWGAVVSEALEEGMKVIGTYEAGSSATILPKDCLFHSGDWKSLLRLLRDGAPKNSICNWSAKYAAEFVSSYEWGL